LPSVRSVFRPGVFAAGLDVPVTITDRNPNDQVKRNTRNGALDEARKVGETKGMAHRMAKGTARRSVSIVMAAIDKNKNYLKVAPV